MIQRRFTPEVLNLDLEKEVDRIRAGMRNVVFQRFKRKGAVLGLSGGVDSSVVAALAVHTFGKDRVFGLLMPERDSAAETLSLSRGVAEHLGIQYVCEDITPMLEATGCYTRRDDAIRLVVPDYNSRCKCKIVLPPVTYTDSYRIFSVVVQYADGRQTETRLDMEAYLGVVAASNFKQRCRKMLEYYHADRLNYAVLGTPNRLEYDQGFFVKLGDGNADIKPIAHLYKTQVYQLARFLGLPEDVCSRPPTTDTYSMPQSQEEFYFSLPYDKMDLVMYGKDHGFSTAEIGPAVDLEPEQVERVFRDIDGKRRMARYLHSAPVMIEETPAEEKNGSEIIQRETYAKITDARISGTLSVSIAPS